jgi:hypothetical protein
MVGPSMSDRDRENASRQLRIGFVLTVGLSGALVALTVGGSLLEIGVAALGSLLLGAILITYLGRLGKEFNP